MWDQNAYNIEYIKRLRIIEMFDIHMFHLSQLIIFKSLITLNAVMRVCTAWSSRVTANRRDTNRAFVSRTTDSGTAGTPCMWQVHGGSSSVIGEHDISSMPKRFPVPVKRKLRTTASGNDIPKLSMVSWLQRLRVQIKRSMWSRRYFT